MASITSEARANGAATPRVDLASSCRISLRTINGEDAAGYGSSYQVVADGVRKSDGSSAEFSKCIVSSLLENLRAANDDGTGKMIKETVKQALLTARKKFNEELNEGDDPSRYCCTLNVAFVDRSRQLLHCFALGDSKSIVIRGDAVAFETANVIHGFNTPAVLSNVEKYDHTKVLSHESFQIEDGDVILTFTDGISDNIYERDLLELVASNREKEPSAVAEALVRVACRNCGDKAFVRPSLAHNIKVYHQLATANADKSPEDEAAKQHVATATKLLKTIPPDAKVLLKERCLLPEKRFAFYSLEDVRELAQPNRRSNDDISVCVTFVHKSA